MVSLCAPIESSPADAAGVLTWKNAIRSGTLDIVNGVSVAITVSNMSANTRIFIQANDTVPGAGNLTIDYRPLAANRVNGASGSFKATAVLGNGTINTADQSVALSWFALDL